MTELRVEIPAVCEVHGSSGYLMVQRAGERIILDGPADECCVFSLPDASVTLLFDVLGELLP